MWNRTRFIIAFMINFKLKHHPGVKRTQNNNIRLGECLAVAMKCCSTSVATQGTMPYVQLLVTKKIFIYLATNSCFASSAYNAPSTGLLLLDFAFRNRGRLLYKYAFPQTLCYELVLHKT